MFLAAKIQYAHIKNQFNSFNTDQQSIRKSKNVSLSLKKPKLTPNLPSITRGPLRENYGTPRDMLAGGLASWLDGWPAG